MNTVNQARQLLSNRMSELGYPFSSYYEKETLNLMIEFAKIQCELQKQECYNSALTIRREDSDGVEVYDKSILECKNMCDE